MSGPVAIPAKPTRYKGIQYRSRLEAGWAVFWDAVSSSSSVVVTYEDFTDVRGDPLSLLEMLKPALSGLPPWLRYDLVCYTPDFRIQLTEDYAFFQEVKPAEPSEQYTQLLHAVQLIIGDYGYSLLLTLGGFRDETLPTVRGYPYAYGMDALLAFYGFGIDAELLIHSANTAANFRWDLYRETK